MTSNQQAEDDLASIHASKPRNTKPDEYTEKEQVQLTPGTQRELEHIRTQQFFKEELARARDEIGKREEKIENLQRVEVEHAELTVLRRGDRWKDALLAILQTLGGIALALGTAGYTLWFGVPYVIAFGVLFLVVPGVWQFFRSVFNTP